MRCQIGRVPWSLWESAPTDERGGRPRSYTGSRGEKLRHTYVLSYSFYECMIQLHSVSFIQLRSDHCNSSTLFFQIAPSVTIMMIGEVTQPVVMFGEELKPGVCVKAMWGLRGLTPVVGVIHSVVIVNHIYPILKVEWLSERILAAGLLATYRFREEATGETTFMPPARVRSTCSYGIQRSRGRVEHITVEKQPAYAYWTMARRYR